MRNGYLTLLSYESPRLRRRRRGRAAFGYALAALAVACGALLAFGETLL